MKWVQGIIAVVCLVTAGCASSGSSGEAHGVEEVREAQERGVASARMDLERGAAVVYVFRQVKDGERDAVTGWPLRDAGTDAAAPEWAAFVAGYNQTVQGFAPGERR